MRAARGTPVGDEDTPAGSRRRIERPRVWLLFAGVALTAWVVDQVTKHLAERELADGDVSVIGDVLQLHLTYNPGAAFSLGTDFTVVLSCLALTATVVVVWLSRRLADRVWAVGLGLVLAGIDGNLTDRMFRDPAPFRGHVVDFLMLPNWPVFNVADIAINLGAAIILIQVFRGIELTGDRVSAKDADEAEDAS